MVCGSTRPTACGVPVYPSIVSSYGGHRYAKGNLSQGTKMTNEKAPDASEPLEKLDYCGQHFLSFSSSEHALPYYIVCSRCEDIVRSRSKDSKKNMNNFAILHAIVTQLVPINWQWKCTYYTKNQLCTTLGSISKLKNRPLSKAYRHVVCVPGFISAYCNVNSTWLLHDNAHITMLCITWHGV